ncbi:hypothetical protein R1flu_024838 [Riccia fluitans]|uniref:Uncharacterized protein n=1 Tax=Riccia fluitans TaxID=41844 RepID=A0ABD1XW12_9MARC
MRLWGKRGLGESAERAEQCAFLHFNESPTLSSQRDFPHCGIASDSKETNPSTRRKGKVRRFVCDCKFLRTGGHTLREGDRIVSSDRRQCICLGIPMHCLRTGGNAYRSGLGLWILYSEFASMTSVWRGEAGCDSIMSWRGHSRRVGIIIQFGEAVLGDSSSLRITGSIS